MRTAGELDFGPEAEWDHQEERLRWYHHWLKGEATGTLESPPVRLFLTGRNILLGLADWPPPDTREFVWHLGVVSAPSE